MGVGGRGGGNVPEPNEICPNSQGIVARGEAFMENGGVGGGG